MATGAKIPLVAVKAHSIRQNHFVRRAQREASLLVGSMTREAADFRRIGDEFFRVHLARFDAFDESLVSVTPLTIIRVGVGSVSKRAVTGGQILSACAPDWVSGL
jgi:hypothetical protein